MRGTTALNNHTRIAPFRKADDDISDRPYAGETVKPFRLYDDEEVGTFRLYDEEPTEDGLQPIGESLVGAAFRLHMTGADDLVSERELEKALGLVDDGLREQAREAWAKGLTKGESAIEKVLLPWLVCQRYPFFMHHPAVLFAGETHAYEPMTLAVIPQLPIGRFRADFALAGSRGGLVRFVVVECDGKEFHDGVENVTRDLNRDVAILANKRVLDVGSGDINGNNNFLLENCLYDGNDVIEAKNVTVVSKTKDLPFSNHTFDTIVSTECFEHDPEYRQSFEKIYHQLP